MSYAFVDDIPYRKSGALYSDDQLIERVPRIAICLNLGKDSGPLLFHCDDAWNTLGTSGSNTIADTKELAERNYPGVSARWIDLNTSIEDALRYYDQLSGMLWCSFCGKRPFEIEGGVVEGGNVAICQECVEEYYEGSREDE